MTPERKLEIRNATKESPVRITGEEMAELREESKARMQMDIGAGKLVCPVADDSPAARMWAMKNKGMSHAAIANELSIGVGQVDRTIERTYV